MAAAAGLKRVVAIPYPGERFIAGEERTRTTPKFVAAEARTMTQPTLGRWRTGWVRELLLSVLGLGVLVWLLDFRLTAAAPIALLVGTSVLHDLLDERYGLPRGSNWVFYGASVAVLGVGALVLGALWGAGFVVVGLWFVLDGVATVRHGSPRDHHEYAADADGDSSSEVMLRMQVLGSVHEELREADGPRTAEEVAETLGLAEERAASALDYLETRGQAERVDGDGYRAVEQRWGRTQPAVSFLRWLPRRLLRPFRLLARLDD